MDRNSIQTANSIYTKINGVILFKILTIYRMPINAISVLSFMGMAKKKILHFVDFYSFVYLLYVMLI